MEAKSPMHPNIIEQPNDGPTTGVNPMHNGRSVEPSERGDTGEENTGSKPQNVKSIFSFSSLPSLNPLPSMSNTINNIHNTSSRYKSVPEDPTEQTDGQTNGQTDYNILDWIYSLFGQSDNGDTVVPGDESADEAVATSADEAVVGDVSVAPSATQSSVLTRLGSVYGAIWNGIASMASSSPTPRIIGFKPLLLQGPSLQYVFLLLLFVILIIYFITYVVYIKSNWEDVKCREGRFWLAPLFGKDTDETIRDCTSRQIKISIDNNLEAENTRMGEIEQMVRDLSNNVTEYSGDSLALGEGAEGEMSNITDTLQHNVNYVKEALSTILASIWISTQMNNGALTSYSDLQSSEISNIIDKYNNVDGNFNTYQ